MRKSDAKKVLSGNYTIDFEEMFEITLWGTKDPTTGVPIVLNHKDIQFMLRQLALKVTREKE
jgi:hypothetical protein